MFQIKAGFDDQIEVKATPEKAREFFNDTRNFLELMPGVESITEEAGGARRWTIAAPVPVIGSMSASFLVRQTEDSPQLIEWSPAPNEKQNLLRYSAEFESVDKGRTRVRIVQDVELRRESAKELHTFAGWIGEKRISDEMQKGIEKMMRAFLQRAQEKLEASKV
ncbi:MAG: SRPBCC family protein [Pyrinomonadaceae bacterium]|nr:SRPBCC family protein [Pyrinomonadaceae bacterium]